MIRGKLLQDVGALMGRDGETSAAGSGSSLRLGSGMVL